MKEHDAKKILITGGCGFIGSNLVEFLLTHTSWSIVVLDNLSTGTIDRLTSTPHYARERVVFFEGDITRKEDVASAMEGCHAIVNLAAQTGIVPSLQNPLEGIPINILGVVNLLETAKERGIEKFVNASSSGTVLG